MANMLLEFFQNDVFRSLSVATIIAYPEIAKWYLPIVYPVSPLDKLQRPIIHAGVHSDSSATVVVITRTASVFRPVTTTLTTQSTVTRTQTDTVTDTTTDTTTRTLFDTTCDTLTATSTLNDGIQYVTIYSGVAYAEAIPRSTFSHTWCDETDIRDEQSPCALRPTPTLAPGPATGEDSPASDDKLLLPGPGWKDILLLVCIGVIGTLLWIIKQRTGQTWMLKKFEEITYLKERLKATSTEVNETSKKNRALEITLENEISTHNVLQEIRRRMLERAKMLFRNLTTVQVSVLKEPKEVFIRVCQEAMAAQEKEKKLVDDLKSANTDCAREIERLKLVVKGKDAEIENIKRHDGRGDMKDFQISQNVKDNAMRRSANVHERQMAKLRAELSKLTRDYDNLKASSDAYRELKDGDLEKLKEQSRHDQENMAALQGQHDSLIQAATQQIQEMQANLDQQRSEKVKCEEGARTLQDKIAALEKKLAEAQQTPQMEEAPHSESSNDGVASVPFRISWLFDPTDRVPPPSEDAL